jgi:hypothetical protein
MRQSVKKFAELMEQVLQENDHKGGWEDCDFNYFFTIIEEETIELRSLFYNPENAYDIELKSDNLKNKAIKEAVDVANFCMMIADVISQRY